MASSFTGSFCRISLALLLYVKPSYSENYHSRSRSYDRDKVRLSSDSPTTFGGNTNFFAQVLNCGGQGFRFCFISSVGRTCQSVNTRSCNHSISSWRSIGKKKVFVAVERLRPTYKDCGSATTYVLVTDTIIATLKTRPSKEPFFTGPLVLSVSIHDPSHMFPTPKYFWDFGDGSYLNNSYIGEISHNFTEQNIYHINVKVFAIADGRLYNGTVYKDLKFEVNFNPNVMVIDSNNVSTLTLPSEDTKTAYVALGRQVELIITYNNPYSVALNCLSQWSISPATHACKLKHTFTEDETTVYVTPTFQTKQENISADPFSKRIVAQEPVSELTIESRNITSNSKYLEANVSCQGKSPFKICWKLSIFSSNSPGDDCLFENCTGLLDSCTLFVNHTITQPGIYTLDVVVINRVGSAHLINQFSFPKPTPAPHKTDAKTAVDIAIPLLICTLIAIILLFVARKVYTIQHRSVLETANFDFRDEDCRSVDSLSVRNKWCPSVRFQFWKRFSKNKEDFPLLDTSSSPQTYYSVIL